MKKDKVEDKIFEDILLQYAYNNSYPSNEVIEFLANNSVNERSVQYIKGLYDDLDKTKNDLPPSMSVG